MELYIVSKRSREDQLFSAIERCCQGKVQKVQTNKQGEFVVKISPSEAKCLIKQGCYVRVFNPDKDDLDGIIINHF